MSPLRGFGQFLHPTSGLRHWLHYFAPTGANACAASSHMSVAFREQIRPPFVGLVPCQNRPLFRT